MRDIRDVGPGDYVKLKDGSLKRIASVWGVRADGTLPPPSEGGFGVTLEDGQRVSMWDARAYFKREDVEEDGG